MDLAVSHKIRLVPNRTQEIYFRKACGTARFTYNWALSEWRSQYQNGHKPNATILKRQFNQLKVEFFPWMSEVTKCAPEQAFRDLSDAFTRFFKGQNNYPKYKKKHKSKDSFYLTNDKFRVDGKYIRIPKLGWVRMREKLRFAGKLMSARVSRVADQWHVAIMVKTPAFAHTTKNHGCVGIDVGLKTFAYMSDGSAISAPKPLVKLQAKLKRLERSKSRKVLGSNNRKKIAIKIARLHNRIANIRKDFLHKLTSRIALTTDVVAIESLQVAGMLKNHRLAKHVADAGFGEFARQLAYKKQWYGGTLVQADKWFPSSKTCCICGGYKQDLKLSDRIYICEHCGSKIERDFNAAVNIHTLGLREIYACGQYGLCDRAKAEVSQLVEAGINSNLVTITKN